MLLPLLVCLLPPLPCPHINGLHLPPVAMMVRARPSRASCPQLLSNCAWMRTIAMLFYLTALDKFARVWDACTGQLLLAPPALSSLSVGHAGVTGASFP